MILASTSGASVSATYTLGCVKHAGVWGGSASIFLARISGPRAWLWAKLAHAGGGMLGGMPMQAAKL